MRKPAHDQCIFVDVIGKRTVRLIRYIQPRDLDSDKN